MAQSMNRAWICGDYIVKYQIGWGSFSTVWLAIHRVHGFEVAIKEIATARLNKKLQENLLSEIDILKRIKHPNIIRLYETIVGPKTINIVLEYCGGGDLSKYIQSHERVSEATAKDFMQQLASGLQILWENNLIHRDLKPQNLLLSSNDDQCILKIADFGFARLLEERDLAETMCGSPLYMAPEIMQFRKYDAKADLWSVGAILFQLVTGNTPFTGNNPQELLENILKSKELCFPSNNNNLSSHCIDLCEKLLRPIPEERLTFEEFFKHPFLSETQPEEPLSSQIVLKEPITTSDQRPLKGLGVVDSLELIELGYVFVPNPSVVDSFASIGVSGLHDPSCQSEGFPMPSINQISALVSIPCASVINPCGFGTLESPSSTPSETSPVSMDTRDPLEQSSSHYLTRIRSLQRFASAIKGLVNEKVEERRQLEAFSIHLVVLAIWNQAMDICKKHAASSALEESPDQEVTPGPMDVCSQIQEEFLLEVGFAEELSMALDPNEGSSEMPDAMETIFQYSLALGRRGAGNELIGDTKGAECRYSRAVELLLFLLEEAPSLPIRPPFSLTNSDKIRLQTYIDILKNRRS